MAPPPKPMIAMPVAMPRRSGNHLINVETGGNITKSQADAAQHASAEPDDPKLVEDDADGAD